MAKTNNVPKLIEKEVETVNVFDRHTRNWFIDQTNVLKVGANFSDFLNGKTEEFALKKIHLCDEKYWKLAETTDGKFILLNRNKILK